MEWKSYFFFLLSGFSSVRSRLVSLPSPDPPEPAVNRSVAGCAHRFPGFSGLPAEGALRSSRDSNVVTVPAFAASRTEPRP